MEKIYLASPYSDPDPDVREERYRRVCIAASKIIDSGSIVYSAIAHTHGISEYGKLPKSWEFWQEQDKPYMEWATCMMVLCLPGWEKSVGVKAEVKIMEEAGKPVIYIDEDIKILKDTGWNPDE